MTYGEFFLQSARFGDLEEVKECLEEEVPVDHCDPDSGNTGLMLACANGHLEVIKVLL